MNNSDSQVTYFAKTDYRNEQIPFGIKEEDRSRHLYVIGKTGMGKSTLLENMAIQDIQNGNGLAFVDPHGKSSELLLDYIPEHRIQDVMYFAPFDMEYPISFNVMEDIGPDRRHLVVNGLMSTFEKIWVDAWSARMAYILSNTLLALLEYPDSNLLGINRMLLDKEYRKLVIQNIKDPSVKSFWVDEFAKYTDRFAAEATPAIQNKVGQFTSNPLIRNIVGQNKSSFNLREMMDKKKILIVNLSKGLLGEGNANLLGSMLVTKIYLAAMSRADVSQKDLQNLPRFNLYVDEFQSFANKSFADILSESRKYKLNLTIAHQYIEQMEEEVRPAVFGNVGTLITFRVGAYDAEFLEKEFSPVFMADDLVNLGIYQIYLKLMIDGVSSSPFSAVTLPPITKSSISWKEEVIASSRKLFSHPRVEVEQKIVDWHKAVIKSDQKIDNNKQYNKLSNNSFENNTQTHRSDINKAYIDSNNINKKTDHNSTHNPFAKAFITIKNSHPSEDNNKSKVVSSGDSNKHFHKNDTNLIKKHDERDGTLRELLNDVMAHNKELPNRDMDNKAKEPNINKNNKPLNFNENEVSTEVLKTLLNDEKIDAKNK